MRKYSLLLRCSHCFVLLWVKCSPGHLITFPIISISAKSIQESAPSDKALYRWSKRTTTATHHPTTTYDLTARCAIITIVICESRAVSGHLEVNFYNVDTWPLVVSILKRLRLVPAGLRASQQNVIGDMALRTIHYVRRLL